MTKMNDFYSHVEIGSIVLYTSDASASVVWSSLEDLEWKSWWKSSWSGAKRTNVKEKVENTSYNISLS